MQITPLPPSRKSTAHLARLREESALLNRYNVGAETTMEDVLSAVSNNYAIILCTHCFQHHIPAYLIIIIVVVVFVVY
jgi:hypothetical protein